MMREFLKLYRFNKAKRREFSTISIQTPIQNVEGEESGCLEDIISYDELGFQEIELKDQIEYALSRFSGKQLEIVKYFIENGKCNQKTVAKLFGVSQSYISRVLSRFKKLIES
jgi:DNA-directed RNA polymerase specialized sigma subunit